MEMNFRGLTAAFTSGALTATGAETVYDTTVTITYCIDGRLYSKTAVTDGATPTADPVNSTTFTGLATNRGSAFVWCLNTSGTVGVFQGPVVEVDDSELPIDPEAFPLPTIPDGYCPFAYQVVVHGDTGSGEWNFGTDNWNATGVEDAIVNVATLPKRPVTDTVS